MLSRGWLILVSLLAALATAAALLAPRPLGDELDVETGRRLERAQQATALFLKVNARQWMDTVAHDATDAVLVNGLVEATKGPADLGILHKTVQERLRAFAEKSKVDLVLATDAKGRVVARAGVDDGVYKDFVEGFPLVADALRGLRGDDTWSLDGKLYRVAASPVIATAPGKYAGTLVMGQEVGPALAQSLATYFGVDVAFLLRGRLIASSTALPVAQQLPLSASEQAAVVAKDGRSPLLTLGAGDGRYLAVLAPFAGEAAGHGALYAVLAARPPTESVTGLMARLISTDPKTLPWSSLAPVGAGLVVGLLIGLLLLRIEFGSPLKKLVRDTQSLARGELPRIQDALHPGLLGQVARAVNTTLDRLGSHPATPQPPPLSRRHVPTPTSVESPRGKADRLFDLGAQPPNTAPTMPDLPSSRGTPLPAPLPPPIHSGDEYTPSVPTTVKTGKEGPDYVDAPPGRAGARPAASLGALKLDEDEEQTTVAAKSTYPSALAMAEMAQTDSQAVTTLGPPPQPEPDLSDPIEAELHAVFTEFLETKQRCGEPTEGVTYDKFAEKLRANRATLIAKYSCKTVKFQVYIKDGKAALKATPVT
jgi:Double sensory domain of two-component sensor kinase